MRDYESFGTPLPLYSSRGVCRLLLSIGVSLFWVKPDGYGLNYVQAGNGGLLDRLPQMKRVSVRGAPLTTETFIEPIPRERLARQMRQVENLLTNSGTPRPGNPTGAGNDLVWPKLRHYYTPVPLIGPWASSRRKAVHN